MRLIRGLHHIQSRHRGAIATLGTFDGVHLGHRQMIQHVVAAAKAQQAPSLVMIFEPHPSEYFQETPPARITTLREKCAQLEKLGVDYVLCLHFNQKLSQLSAHDFVQQLLVDKLGVKAVMVGDDFRFGHQRQGDFALLKSLGDSLGFEAWQQATIAENGERVSSSRVREALKQGDFELAERLLGRPYSMLGRVYEGDKRGRLLGYPTANINPKRKVVPIRGVFAVEIQGLDKPYAGMANLGTRPTVSGTKTLLEVNIFDFKQDIYGRWLDIVFIEKIRDEKRFESLDALKAQIANDEQTVKGVMSHG